METFFLILSALFIAIYELIANSAKLIINVAMKPVLIIYYAISLLCVGFQRKMIVETAKLILNLKNYGFVIVVLNFL